MDEEVYVYSPDLSVLKSVCYTLTLTGKEAVVVRAALSNHADDMERRAGGKQPAIFDDYMLDVATCDAVVKKLNKAEGRG